MTEFLPVTKKEIEELGWDRPDFVLVSGDAYVDHPSFGVAIISRLLASQGFRVAVLAQPEYRHSKDFCRFGPPKYAFLVSAGNIDSMVAHYTAAKKKRSDDAYTPGNKAGRRPDRAAIVYSRLAKEAYPGCPVILGGIEASLRRFAHYDYWEDKVLPSLLVDSGADLLIFGMGEGQVSAIGQIFASGGSIKDMADLPGICRLAGKEDGVIRSGPAPSKAKVFCPSLAEITRDKKAYAMAAKMQLTEQDHIRGRTTIQEQGPGVYLIQNPPAAPLTRQELDRVFAMPFARTYHPSYENQGGVKAIEEVEFSLLHNRGCFGGCHFCAITLHQGRHVVSRSHRSVIEEAKGFLHQPHFKGYIHDVGGPTANFRSPSCQQQKEKGVCPGRLCLTPKPCPSLQVDHSDYLKLLRELRQLPGVKKVFIRSGLRYDYMLLEKNDAFLEELCRHHVSGQLKVAPEHSSPKVLALMGKPSIGAFDDFARRYKEISAKIGKEQYLVPYLMSSHPGSTLKDAIDLALFLKSRRMRPEQVQDFYPTPGTISTAMFYTGFDPYTMKALYVPRTAEEKRKQRLLLQYYKKENQRQIIKILVEAGREDLIGYGKEQLVPPDRYYLYAGKEKADGAKPAPPRGSGQDRGSGQGRNSGQAKSKSGRNSGQVKTERKASQAKQIGSGKPPLQIATAGKKTTNKKTTGKKTAGSKGMKKGR